MTDSKARIVIGNSSLVGYPQAGGLWSWLLQYPLGLLALGHEVLWLEEFHGSGDSAPDRKLIGRFLERMRAHGLGERCAVIAHRDGLEHATVHGGSRRSVRRFIESADALWNIAAAIRNPLLSLFRRRALIDGDPGHLQVSALDWDMGIDEHEALVSMGGKLHDPDCEVPTLGRDWARLPAPVHMPFWESVPGAGPDAPFTSVTQWNWEELWFGERTLSISKREAYMRYLELPERSGLRFELAANIHPTDPTRDAERLRSAGWAVVDPHVTTPSPHAYRDYIARSSAELCCPKPIYRELRTGWFSDRSAAYLASGRPVLAEDTGFGDWLPTGEGLVPFRDLDEAVAGARSIASDYAVHSEAARVIAEDHLDARKVLPKLLEATIS